MGSYESELVSRQDLSYLLGAMILVVMTVVLNILVAMLAGSKKDTSYDDTGYKDTICHATSYEETN